MNILESIKVAIHSIFSNKLRSILTMLGIIIGISSVIAVVSIGEGSRRTIDNEFKQFGSGLSSISMNWAKEYSSYDLMTYEDIEAIKDAFSQEIPAIMATNRMSGGVKWAGKEYNVDFVAADENYKEIEKVKIIKGRYLNSEDVSGKRQVAVIDKTLAMELYKSTDVVGKYLDLYSKTGVNSIGIVGVYEADRKLMGMGMTSSIAYMPYTTIRDLEGGGNELFNISFLLPRELANRDQVRERLLKLVERRHSNEGEDLYMISSAEEEMESINKITGIITLVISAIAAISLLVGGIGIMNIMFVSVTERTREIGIRKAIGAKRRDILLQFLIESVIISCLGGIIGTIIGLGFAYIAGKIIGISIMASAKSIAIAWIFSAGVGIFFGMYPANKASKLDPIEALRYE